MSENKEILRMATVTERNGSTYTYKIKFDGDEAASQKFYKTMDNLSITIGKRVLCARVSGTWIILGRI